MARTTQYPHEKYIEDKDLDISVLPAKIQRAIAKFTELYNDARHPKGQQYEDMRELSAKILAEIRDFEEEGISTYKPPKGLEATCKCKKNAVLLRLYNKGRRYTDKEELKDEGYPTGLFMNMTTKQFALRKVIDKDSKYYGMYQIIPITKKGAK